MGKKKARKGAGANTIAQNKKARHDYFIEDSFEAGLALQGWEVKSVRDGRVQLREAYVVLKDNEVWLIGAHITPLLSASTPCQHRSHPQPQAAPASRANRPTHRRG